MDHGTDIADNAVRIIIRKDMFIPSRPWMADVEFSNGDVWTGWQEFFRTRKDIVAAARAAAPRTEIVFA